MSNDPIEIGATDILFDTVHDIKIIEGVVRMALLTKRDGETVVAARIAVPLSELPEVIQSLVIALTEAAKVIVKPVLSS